MSSTDSQRGCLRPQTTRKFMMENDSNRSVYDTTCKTLTEFGRSTVWTLYTVWYPMHRMLAFCNKAQNQQGIKMILNISLALLKSRDDGEALTLHSLFYPSSQ